jgi:hypothetical protein
MAAQLEITQNDYMPREDLHPKQHAAITLLLQGRSYTSTADAVGIERKVLWQWRKNPAFRAALNAELAAIRQAALVRTLALAEKAVDALQDVLENGETDGARIAAAKLVLDRVGVTRLETARPEDATPTSPDEGKTVVLVDNLESISEENRRRLSAAHVVLLDARQVSEELRRRRMAEAGEVQR